MTPHGAVDACDAATYNIVSMMISKSSATSSVSTRDMLRACRSQFPECGMTDEELVRLLVAKAIGRSRSIEFDHR